jgi:hypothetical protein
LAPRRRCRGHARDVDLGLEHVDLDVTRAQIAEGDVGDGEAGE